MKHGSEAAGGGEGQRTDAHTRRGRGTKSDPVSVLNISTGCRAFIIFLNKARLQTKSKVRPASIAYENRICLMCNVQAPCCVGGSSPELLSSPRPYLTATPGSRGPRHL